MSRFGCAGRGSSSGAGSIASTGSVGSIASIGSIGSIGSSATLGRVGSSERTPGRRAAATGASLAAFVAIVAAVRLAAR